MRISESKDIQKLNAIAECRDAAPRTMIIVSRPVAIPLGQTAGRGGIERNDPRTKTQRNPHFFFATLRLCAFAFFFPQVSAFTFPHRPYGSLELDDKRGGFPPGLSVK
jgi:hypothetical protein